MPFPRATGILLHPTSLPSRGGIGDFGLAAYEFVDFLAAGRQGLWQVLPLGPVGYGNSPYSSTSAFAGNPLLISVERLADHASGLYRALGRTVFSLRMRIGKPDITPLFLSASWIRSAANSSGLHLPALPEGPLLSPPFLLW